MNKAHRVISLLPSATETLCLLGHEASALLYGRSHECNYPADITHLPILTGQKTSTEWTSAAEIDAQVSSMISEGQSLYTINENLIRELKPNIILTQDICEVCAIDLQTVERIAHKINRENREKNSAEGDIEVISLNPLGLYDVLDDVKRVSVALNMESEGEMAYDLLVNRIENVKSISATHSSKEGYKAKNIAFIEWPEPLYVGGHWTPYLIQLAGGSHPLNPVLADKDGAGKSFPVTKEAFVESEPDIIVISPCGLKLKEAEAEARLLMEQEWFRELKAVKDEEVYIVDGDAHFNRPGPRLVQALEWLCSIIHGDINTVGMEIKDFPYIKL